MEELGFDPQYAMLVSEGAAFPAAAQHWAPDQKVFLKHLAIWIVTKKKRQRNKGSWQRLCSVAQLLVSLCVWVWYFSHRNNRQKPSVLSKG